MIALEKLSFCGIYCGGCLNFKKNYNCQGCRVDETLLEDCPFIPCAKAKTLTHCGECQEFPCTMMSDFYNDGNPSHYKAFENMKEIIEIGHEAWLLKAEQSSCPTACKDCKSN